eukprot:2616371-Rhodomonas_salina.2
MDSTATSSLSCYRACEIARLQGHRPSLSGSKHMLGTWETKRLTKLRIEDATRRTSNTSD